MQAIIKIKGLTPYSQSKMHAIPRADKESADDHERRTWRYRVHVDAAGDAFMPPMSLKKALQAASSYMGKIPGQGQATYTKRFRAGVAIYEPIALFLSDGTRARLESFEGEPLMLDAQGKSNSGKRVLRFMPRLLEGWTAVAKVQILDELITKSVLAQCLAESGSLVGVGRFRPENGGFYGRFSVESIEM